MELTEKQKEMVADFLREQDKSMGELPADKRVQVLTQIKQRVREELLKVGKEVLSDGRVESVLERIHITVPSSDSTAPKPSDASDIEAAFPKTTSSDTTDAEPIESPQPSPTPPATETFDTGRHWMGVCEVLSDQYNQPVEWIRRGFIALGCLTGPIALLVYLGLLFYTRKKNPERYPEFDLTTVLTQTIRLVALALGLHMIAFVLLFTFSSLYIYFAHQPAELGSWYRLSEYNALLLTFLLFTLGSTAALSAMPLAHQWDKTFATITKLGLAIYAVILCAGVSLSITGYLLSGLNMQLGR